MTFFGETEEKKMNKWYRKPVAKVVVSLIAIITGAVMVTSLLTALTMAGTANPVDLKKLTAESFADSTEFNELMELSMFDVMEQIRLENLFETDGAYDPHKLVDVTEYYQNGTISGVNRSGVAYTLEELESWSEEAAMTEESIYDDNAVIVCEKPDGTYYYYYLDEFVKMVEDGRLKLDMTNGAEAEELLRELEEGVYTSPGLFEFRILNEENQVLYTSCWNFGQSVREKYAPEGAENLLELLNETPQLNGKMSYIYDQLSTILVTIYADIQSYKSGWEYMEEGNTNFTYLYIDGDTKKVVTNKSEYQNYAEAEKNIREMQSGDSTKYIVIYPRLKDFQTNMDVAESSEWDMVREYDQSRRWNSTLAVAVDTDFPIPDRFYEASLVYNENVPYLRISLITSIVSAVMFLVLLIWVTMIAGRENGDSELHFTTFDRCKTEIAAALVIAVWVIGTYFFAKGWSGISTNIGSSNMIETFNQYRMDGFQSDLLLQSVSLAEVIGLFLYGLFTFTCFFVGYSSLVRRIKGKRLWTNSVIHMIMSFGGEVIQARSVTFKALLVLVAFMLVQFLALVTANFWLLLIMLGVDTAVAYVVLSSAIAKGRIKKGIEEIATGNMSYQIPLRGLRGINRDLAEKVNDIGSGLNKAVAEGMKNERLKTDLITNVSHDIKTPLTSIINYVDILKRSDIQDEKIRGYLDILEAKAQRLKTLTEDVVEASKVSSGNITLECMDVDLVEMIQQTEGEFAEKFAARNLSVVVNLPEEPAVIHVDGRRMWRVLENIFGNAAKYAMPGTRVYADLRLEEDTVDFSLKNISEQQLNISADELTERFIRGDISRSTEGSGLGLSIAKSLTAMQGGQFELYLDGDLFRVNIRFPRVKK